MKKIHLFIAFLTLSQFLNAQITDPGQVAKDGATDHVNNNVSNGVNNGLDKTENAIKGLFKKKNKAPKMDSTKVGGTVSGNNSAPLSGSLRAYANYDFVPGDVVVFEDHFTDDRDGEFPAHWELEKGQAVLNQLGGVESLCLTDGNYCVVKPRVKNLSYLGKQFTIEYDVYNPGSAYGPVVFFRSGGDDLFTVSLNTAEAACDFPDNKSLNGFLPAEIREDKFNGKWHHIAIAYSNKQVKVYVDQYRVLVVPDVNAVPSSTGIEGIGDQNNPIIVSNVRIATGGSMNMLGQKFTDAKIVTHGINFDIDKSGLQPESMGTLNVIVQLLKNNPEVKFEIDGHTDNTGNAQHNLQLSQQRADAVKAQLVAMGIDGARLTTKGYGDTKPIGDNNSPEGKANNRRVEFVRM